MLKRCFFKANSSKLKYYSTKLSTKKPSEEYERLVTRSEIKPDDRQRYSLRYIDKLFEDLKDYSPSNGRTPKGIYIFGGVGAGKTMLMDLFFDCCSFIKKKQRTHFNKFMLNFHSRMYQLRKKEKGKDFVPELCDEILQESWLLCFDEFQVTDIADAMILKRLFENLIERGAVIFATSNRRPDDLYLNGINRDSFLPFIDVIKAKNEIIDINSLKDYRLSGTKVSQVYIFPLENSKNIIDDLFKNLIQNENPEPEFLDFKGRTLLVPLSARKVAKFSFKDLCEKQLSAVDYIAIAENFHTVIITDIPYFNLNSRDLMRRFILLIDELYQHHVKLICSAVDCPEKLFEDKKEEGGVDEAFAFDRTISRLNEMQTSNYLQMSHKRRQ
eukprot:gene4253-7590_t